MSYTKNSKGYLVRISYKKPDGTYGLKSRQVSRYNEVANAEAELRKSLLEDTPSNIKYSLLLARYLESKKSDDKISSLNFIKSKTERFIIPFFGDKIVCKTRKYDLVQWKEYIDHYYDQRGKKLLSLDYKQALYNVFHGLLGFASSEYKINTPINDMNALGNFKRDPNKPIVDKPLEYWTIEQFVQFITEYKKTIQPGTDGWWRRQTCYVLYNILAFAGLRKGEANGLLVNSFVDDKTQPYLIVIRSMDQKNKDENGNKILGDTKNTSSRRIVPIPSALATIVRDHLELYVKKLYGYNDKFYLVGGNEPVPDSTLATQKEGIETKLGLPHISVHNIRHSYVSMLVNSGIPLFEVSKLVGHSTTAQTEKVYAHMYPSNANAAISKLNDLIQKANDELVATQYILQSKN